MTDENEEGLPGNTLGTILGLIATVIIVVFIYIAVTQVIRDTELEAAQTTVDNLQSKINALAQGQSFNATLQGSKNLQGWYILGWGKQNPNRPDKCFFDGCVCVCKGKTPTECQSRGVCREIRIQNVQITESYTKWEHGLNGLSALVEKQDPFITLKSNLLIIEIKKSQEEIELSLNDRQTPRQ